MHLTYKESILMIASCLYAGRLREYSSVMGPVFGHLDNGVDEFVG